MKENHKTREGLSRAQFDRLPELLTRAEVVACGVPASAVDDLRVPVHTAAQVVAFGLIGAVQLPGRHCKNKQKAKFKYRKADVAVVMGYKTS